MGYLSLIHICHTSEEIMNVFTSLHQEHTTIVLVTHERDIAQYSGRILRFRDGLLEQEEAAVEAQTPEIQEGKS